VGRDLGGGSRVRTYAADVLILVADDLGDTDLECQGGRDISTPNLEGESIRQLEDDPPGPEEQAGGRSPPMSQSRRPRRRLAVHPLRQRRRGTCDETAD
jgi:hypothetical protein